MRVADRTTARNYLKYLNKARNDYANTNDRIVSGSRFKEISEDVSAGSRMLKARSDRYKVDKQLDSVKNINDELSTTEDAMTGINTILADIKKTMIKVATGTVSEADRKILANEISDMQTEILTYANTLYGSKYVFGGTNAGSAPFSKDKDTQELLYNGIKVDSIQKDDNGYFYLKDPADLTSRVPIPMDGDVYMDIGLGIKMSGPNVDPGSAFKISYSGLDFLGFGKGDDGITNNVFNIVSDLIKYTKDYDNNKDNLTAADTKLTEITDKFRVNLTEMGSRTNFLDVMQDRLDKTSDNYTEKIKTLVGIDDYEEATNQAMNDAVLKAVIQMGAKVLPMSLMDYLR